MKFWFVLFRHPGMHEGKNVEVFRIGAVVGWSHQHIVAL